MDILSIRVHTSQSLWMEIYNIYIPNTKTQQTHFDPNLINPSPHSIIIDDFNGHSHLWDHVQPPNAWGNKIMDWIINKDLHILNDGFATCTSRITRNESTPNLSRCGCNWSTKTSWSLSIVINHRIRYQPVIPRKTRWCCNGGDWSSFTNEVESRRQQLPEEPNISIHISLFNNILKSSASFHVGRTKPSKKLMPWINPHVQAKIHNSNRLRHTIHQNRQEWIDACQEVNVAINEAKANSWKDFLHSSVSNADVPDAWKVIRGLNNTPDTNSPIEAMSHNGRTMLFNVLNTSMLHLLTTKASPPSICQNAYQHFRRWNAKELQVQTTFHQHSSNHLVL